MVTQEKFKLTYGTMFNPPEELHTRYEVELSQFLATLGQEYPMLINGKEVFSKEKFEKRSPIDTNQILGIFQKGTEEDARTAVSSAKNAFPGWKKTPWQERVRLLNKAADLIDERSYHIGAVMSLEVGKNRMEAIGDAVETAELIRYACQQMEKNNGFETQMGNDPFTGLISTNRSIMRPYGVWLVISPFNFPGALTGGPAGAALVAGNTIVIKPATDTPLTPYLLTKAFLDAGIPDGVVNFVTGPGRTLGNALVEHPDIAGVTFTGSFDVGMGIFRKYANDGKWVRPTILELGGKNPTIVSRNADIETAALGIVRSAFGLQGQKCSACSRVFVEEPVYDTLVERLVSLTEKLTIGDPTARGVFMGPVINRDAYQDFQDFTAELAKAGKLLTGGKVITEGKLSHGYFVTPTLVAGVPYTHPLWKQEMFLPITTIGKINSLEEGIKLANDVDYGLTSGFYGTEEEAEWFFENTEAGVNYANRPQGATTGAWPGFQPFGGWKGSGATGKNAGGVHYLQMYMHEQNLNLVRKA
ncbi:MAG: 1-pyrroline-5-carboxylate dehydrogenase [Chloroflexi bacterium HGW-Chloroflexi-10]|nr:MAG: 1-pyrroline-5-carboxylate dehydrogenase [Chloroflexi bacterium HGW-Chloroflexi-10]